ncbi:MAG: T9SS type A sorting domain-containing protein [Winogradskyella sp.]|nr:T9SS type A sorting domain-containing protein [Winogradskyella sp.]
MRKTTKRIKHILLGMSLILITAMGFAQEAILFTFDNVNITTDGPDTFYEIDVMIETTNAGSFKLGSGQLYFNYNTTAFGANIVSNNGLDITFPEGEYIAGQYVDGGPPLPIYSNFIENDNTASRFSWAFSQTYSESTFANANVTPTAAKLCHLKLKFVDPNAAPMLMFEDGGTFDDQFFTACGSENSGPFDTADCTNYPGNQITNDSFDSSVPVLSIDSLDSIAIVKTYPIPTKGLLYVDINYNCDYAMTDLNGKLITKGVFLNGTNQIDLSRYDAGVYFLRLTSSKRTQIKKIIIE